MKHRNVVASVVLLAGCSPAPPADNNSAFAVSDTNLLVERAPTADSRGVENAAGSSAENVVQEVPASNWEYRTDRDEMRGSESRFATAQSENSIELGFPYGTVGARLILRQRAQDGTSVMLAADGGQILCNSFSDDDLISIKFDDGPIRRFVCTGPDSGSSEIAFIDAEQEVIAALRRSRRVMLEADFYDSGPQQFRFDTAGLHWSEKGKR